MRILVIEDEPLIAKGIRRGPEQAGYVIELAAEGKAGLEMALTEVLPKLARRTLPEAGPRFVHFPATSLKLCVSVRINPYSSKYLQAAPGSCSCCYRSW